MFYSQWWDSESTKGAGPLHAMNPIRLYYIRQSVASLLNRQALPPIKVFQGLKVLDVGCGGGLLSEGLARLKPEEVWAIDPSPENIEVAKAHQGGILGKFFFFFFLFILINFLFYIFLESDYTKNRDEVIGGYEVKYHNTTIETLSSYINNPSYSNFNDFLSNNNETINQNLTKEDKNNLKLNKQFDVICSLEVIEHVENPKDFIQNCIKCLKPGGSFFISTMNRTLKSKFITIYGAEYLLKVVPIGTHDWEKYLNPEEIIEMMGKNMKMVSKKGLILSPYGSNLSLSNNKPSLSNLINGIKNKYNWKLSDTDLDVNYIMHFVKLENEED